MIIELYDMKHFNYCNELTWKENWNNWCAFNLEELKTFDETIRFSYEEKGVANVCTMNAEEVQRWILSLEQYIKENQLANVSMRWEKLQVF